MTRSSCYLRRFKYLFLAIILTVSPDAFTQSTTTAVATSQTTEPLTGLAAEIAEVLKRAEDQKTATPDAAPPATAIDLLTQAREQLQIREQLTSQTREHAEAVREAPAMLDRVKLELQRTDATTTAPDLPSTATADFLSQRVEERKAELASLEQRQLEIAEEQRRRSTRLAQIPTELTEARRQLSEAEIAANALPGDEDPMVAEARKLLARAQIQTAQSRIEALQEEQARYDSRAELLPLADKLINERIAAKSELLTSLTEKLNTLRRKEATATAQELKQAARETDTSHPLVRMVAAENTSYTEELDLSGIIEKNETMLERLDAVREEAKNIQQQFDSLKQKFEKVGYSDALGILLRKQRKELPNRRAHRELLENLESTLLEVNLKSLEIQDYLHDLEEPSEVAREMLASTAGDMPTTEAQAVRREITDLLQARKDYLTKVHEVYEQHFQTLYSLNAAEEELVENATAYANFIDERILWLPSADPVSVSSVTMAWQKVQSLLSLSTWHSYATRLMEKSRLGIAALAGIFLLIALLLFSRTQWKRRLSDILATAAKNRLAAFRPVILAISYAALSALPIPLLMVLIGLPLASGYDELAALGSGFVRGGIALFVLLLARTIIKRKGVAEVFFVWPEQSLRKLRQTFNVLLWVYVPAVVLVRASQVDGSDASVETARLVLAIALSIVAFLVAKLLHPKQGLLVGLDVYRQSGWLYRLRYFSYIVIPAIFAALAIAALVGYVYTAGQISQRINVTFWLGGGMLLLNEVIFFWILVKRRRLAIEEARKRREAAKAKMAEGESGPSPDASTGAAEPTIDIAAIGRQAGRLLHVFVLGVFIIGLWIVWSDVLPALRYLDTQPLWSVSRQITETVTAGTTQTVDKLVPVTVADVLLAIFIGFIAVVAIRNIPGLLDITLFQKFSVQAGERYAINTLIRYVIILVGVIYIFSLMGLQWKQVQWLAAAVTVGLGFGLQEIFANFVSGLILLFERPVRVGDFVAVGNIKGNITQIRIRATTVVDWDHFEHIIPNKEMITKPVENWTLSDLKRRLMIHVRVPYGCDYDQARDILMKVTQENPFVLKDPAPAAGIELLSETAVVIVVFAHLPNADNYMDARHTLIAEYVRQLSAAGINIPYPQMDIHLDRHK